MKILKLKILYSIFYILTSILTSTFLIPTSTSAAIVGASPTNSLAKGLVGYWTFDGKDMTNGVAADVSGNFATGTPINIATSTFYVPGKIGQALKFDGVDDYVNMGVVSILEGTTSAMTISAWIKPGIVTVGILCIICNSNSNSANFPWGLEFNRTAGRFSLSQAGNGSGTLSAINNTNLKAGVWSHVVAVRTYVSTLSWPTTLYLNGVADGSGTIARSGQSNQTVAIGRYGANNNYYFLGSVDDVRVYNRALSATEITQLYNMGAATKQAVSPSQGSGQLAKGLVGYWTFDGKDMTNGVAADVSGNFATGTPINIATSTFYVPGKIGQALKFDGVNDRVNAGTSTNNLPTFSASVWAKANSNAVGQLVGTINQTGASSGGWVFEMNSGKADFIVDYTTTDLSVIGNAPAVPLGQWVHFVVTWNGSATVSNVHIYKNGVETAYSSPVNGVGTRRADTSLNIGAFNNGSRPFNGTIDDVRVYNRVLSATEILQLYNIGASSKVAVSPSQGSGQLGKGLVGYWTFDGKDMTNGVAADVSGSGDNGSLTNGKFTNIATSTFYRPGKIGQALNFDGINDSLNVNRATSTIATGNVTVSAWINANTLLGNGDVFALADSASSNDVYLYRSTTGVCFAIWLTSKLTACSAANTIKQNVWYHVVGTFSSVSGQIVYINAVSSGTNSNTSRGSTKSALALIGAEGSTPTTFFGGLMDDVRVYNRALSATEITQLYNMGR